MLVTLRTTGLMGLKKGCLFKAGGSSDFYHFKNALLVNFSFLFEGGKGPGEGGTLQS